MQRSIIVFLFQFIAIHITLLSLLLTKVTLHFSSVLHNTSIPPQYLTLPFSLLNKTPEYYISLCLAMFQLTHKHYYYSLAHCKILNLKITPIHLTGLVPPLTTYILSLIHSFLL